MLKLNNNRRRPRTLISVRAKLNRCFDFTFNISNYTIANKLLSIRFKFHPHYSFFKLKSKPNYYTNFSISWKKKKMVPSKFLGSSIFKSLLRRIRRLKKKVTTPNKIYYYYNYCCCCCCWKGTRIRVWIILAMTAYILVAVIIMQSWRNRLFPFKFIYYKASNYAISSGLVTHVYQALINRISSSLGVCFGGY